MREQSFSLLLHSCSLKAIFLHACKTCTHMQEACQSMHLHPMLPVIPRRSRSGNAGTLQNLSVLQSICQLSLHTSHAHEGVKVCAFAKQASLEGDP